MYVSTLPMRIESGRTYASPSLELLERTYLWAAIGFRDDSDVLGPQPPLGRYFPRNHNLFLPSVPYAYSNILDSISLSTPADRLDSPFRSRECLGILQSEVDQTARGRRASEELDSQGGKGSLDEGRRGFEGDRAVLLVDD